MDARQEREPQLTGKRPVEGGGVEEAAFDDGFIGRDSDPRGDAGRLVQDVGVNAVPAEERDLGRQVRRLGRIGRNADRLTLNRQGG